MAATDLVVVINGREIARIERDNRGRLTLTYADGWRHEPEAYPLSLSMPLAAQRHGHKPVETFLWNLLPDNDAVIERWARRFQVSARNPFALLSHVGEDCAGAAQFIRPDRLGVVLDQAPSPVEWLDEAGIAARLRALRADHTAWRAPSDTGQFSLPGAQPKTALLFEDGRWGIPSGRMPTTHILKPPSGEYDGHAENEHLCLRLATALGMITARSEVKWFEDEVAIVIERYDRQRAEAGLVRVHQEDFCQALSVHPSRKYENDGGPSARASAELLRTFSGRPQEDVDRFVDALMFNWLIAGTDAHAKNYSLLIGAEGRARLAPLYDVASILPYDFDLQKVRLAMKIGGAYRLRDVGARQWMKLATDLHVKTDQIVQRIRRMAAELPDHVSDVERQAGKAGLKHPLVARLAARLIERAKRCAELIDMAGVVV